MFQMATVMCTCALTLAFIDVCLNSHWIRNHFFFYIIYLLWIKPLKWHITGQRSVSCLKWLWGSHLPLWYFSGSSTYICWVLLLKTNAVEPVYKELDSSVKSGRCIASLLYSCKPIFRTWRGPKKSLKHWTVRKVRSAKKIKFITFRAT